MFTKSKFAAPLAALALLAAPVAHAQSTTAENTTTIATADIAGPIAPEDVVADSVVMANTGEVVGKIVSVVAKDDGTSELIVQVAGTENETPEKNVTLGQESFLTDAEGNYMVDLTMAEFMELVAEQNPA